MTEADTCRKLVLPKLVSAGWDTEPHSFIIQQLAERGINYATGAAQAGQPDADPFDLLCHLACDEPILTRHQRADRAKKEQAALFHYLGPEAHEILNDLLENYAGGGTLEFTQPDVLQIPLVTEHGNVTEIARVFGGIEQLGTAINQLQILLYAP